LLNLRIAAAAKSYHTVDHASQCCLPS